MTAKKGIIKVDTNDILPIVKKWLYSEHDIFLRELISNSSDAITKREMMARTQNTEIPSPEVRVEIDKEKNTIAVIDNGIGMTGDEVEKYIAQLAFSGARDFVEQMKKSGNESKEDIIGKFGLGFYSTFMVADKVQVDSLSMKEGEQAVRWISSGNTEYTMDESDWSEVGTKVTLHLTEDSKEFLELYKTRSVLKHYCQFMPYPIELKDEKTKEEKKEGEAEAEAPKKDIINDTEPLWKKDPSSLNDEDYEAFYRELFPMDQGPLFWLHLNVDHPFTLQGILYFPKLNPNKPINETNIKLFSKQVFVSDNVKNIIPDFLGMLKGTIDSTDIPLNVSRSALQGDPNIRRLSNYIVKKVGDSLKKLFKDDRTRYENVWDDIGIFVKYGVVSDTKFDDLMRDRVIFRNSDKKFVTLKEYQESIPAEYKDKLKNKVIYFEKERGDNNLKNQLLSHKVHTIETDEIIDPHFMQHVEMHKKEDSEGVSFTAVDSIFEELMHTEENKEADTKVQELFMKVFGLEKKEGQEEKKENMTPSDMPNLEVEVKHLKNKSPAYFKVDEQMKRFQQMTRSMGNTQFNMPIKKTLVVNPESPLVQNAVRLWENESKKKIAEKICFHIQDLATLAGEGMTNEEREKFVERSQDLMTELTK